MCNKWICTDNHKKNSKNFRLNEIIVVYLHSQYGIISFKANNCMSKSAFASQSKNWQKI